MNENDVNAMFDSGVFNDIVQGAVIVTLKNLNCYNKNDIDDIVYELERGTFEQYRAEDFINAFNAYKAE